MNLTTYQLRKDKKSIKNIQDATLSTQDYGIFPEHGLLGSKDWWKAIEYGKIELITYRGTIKRTFMSGHNDYPIMETEDESGSTKTWARDTNSPKLDKKYVPGAKIEIDYVLGRHRKLGRPGKETEVVIEIRVQNAC
jgi:hypothetical protein